MEWELDHELLTAAQRRGLRTGLGKRPTRRLRALPDRTRPRTRNAAAEAKNLQGPVNPTEPEAFNGAVVAHAVISDA